ncbi:TIGR03086 family metal-binding protein [soil metagenome]
MTEISERYDRNAATFAAKVGAVPDDQWASPSPCEGWTARDVVRHVIDAHGIFLGLVGRELGDIPPVDDDPAAAFDAARRQMQDDLDDPDRGGEEFDGFFGRTTFAAAIDRFLSGDLVVHGWDLARATGLDERLDAAEVQRALEEMPKFGDALRSPQTFGPALEPPPGADDQAKLLAFLGRQP